MSSGSGAPPPRLVRTYLAVFLAVYFLIGLHFVANQENPKTYDCPRYLALAVEIRHEGGWLPLLRDHFTGRFRQSNLQPLYPALLSLSASNSIAFWPSAKLITLALSTLAILAIFLAVRRLFGVTEAVIASMLVAVSHRWLDHATQVTVDPLLTLFTTLSWWWTIEALGGRRDRILAAGIATGLAFVTKGNGIFMLPIWVLGLAAFRGVRAVISRDFALFLAGFLLAAMPLLWRNTLVYGWPTFNDNANYMWASRWSDSWSPEFHRDPVTFTRYLASHGWFGIFDRLARGAYGVFLWMIESLRGFPVGGATYWFVGGGLLLVAHLRMARDADRPRRFVSLGHVLLYWYFFAWWMFVYNEARFVFPVLPVVAAYGASALTRLPEIGGLAREFWETAFLRAGTFLLAATAILASFALTEAGWSRVTRAPALEIRWTDPERPAEERLYGRISPIFALREYRGTSRAIRENYSAED